MIQKYLSPHAERAYGLLRIVAGTMWAFHGAQKLFGILGDGPPRALSAQMWLGGTIELVCGILVALGFKTSWAAFLASGTMAVAYIQFHWQFQLGRAFFPIVNKGEMALLYAFVFLLIACKGAGPWALDSRRRA